MFRSASYHIFYKLLINNFASSTVIFPAANWCSTSSSAVIFLGIILFTMGLNSRNAPPAPRLIHPFAEPDIIPSQPSFIYILDVSFIPSVCIIPAILCRWQQSKIVFNAFLCESCWNIFKNQLPFRFPSHSPPGNRPKPNAKSVGPTYKQSTPGTAAISSTLARPSFVSICRIQASW